MVVRFSWKRLDLGGVGRNLIQTALPPLSKLRARVCAGEAVLSQSLCVACSCVVAVAVVVLDGCRGVARWG